MFRTSLLVNKLQPCLLVVQVVFVSAVMFTGDVHAQNKTKEVRFHETFADLDDWEPLTFRKIDWHSKYTDRAKMVIRRTGNEHAGGWVAEKINILEDYQKAFGEDPPAKATIAVMNDSDNTGASSMSWFDDIRVIAEDKNK